MRPMLRFTSSFALALIMLSTSCMTVSRKQETGFLNRSLELDGKTHRYVVWVPPEYDPNRKWPVVLFLHGSGERGDDGWRQTAIGLGAEIRWNPDLVPAIVVFPQAPADTRWLGAEADLAIRALELTTDELNGDPRRTYLTGLSMGGYGTWHLALAHPEKFAAIVPVCGGIVKPETAQSVRTSPLVADQSDPYGFAAAQLRHIPVWIFHGAGDAIIPPSESRRMFAELRDAGANVQYTEYEGVGHDSWVRAYGDREMWNWLFARRLP